MKFLLCITHLGIPSYKISTLLELFSFLKFIFPGALTINLETLESKQV